MASLECTLPDDTNSGGASNNFDDEPNLHNFTNNENNEAALVEDNKELLAKSPSPSPPTPPSQSFDSSAAFDFASSVQQKGSKRDLDDNDDLVADKKIRHSGDSNSHVVATHYNKLEEKGLAARYRSPIFFMRNFNNWIKSMLINEYITNIKSTSKLGAPLRVLDMCCGKGGDLLKWEKANITHLICTDIAGVSLEQCESRYKTTCDRSRNQFGAKMFSAEFFACDSTRVRLREQYKDPSIELNLVSCQFAFHYCFESLKQAECMIKNAAECLRAGGYFIGTIPDSNEIMRRQRLAESNNFGNEIYQISFLCDTECPPLFGGKYNFKLEGVVDCPEFLVHFPLFIKLARKFGLELVMKESFGEYFKRMSETGIYYFEIIFIINLTKNPIN